MTVSSYILDSLPLKLPNKRIEKGMNFPFPLLKLSNKESKEYFKIILLFPFHSILFLPFKRGLKYKEK